MLRPLSGSTRRPRSPRARFRRRSPLHRQLRWITRWTRNARWCSKSLRAGHA